MLKFEDLPEINSERWMSLEDFDGEEWRDIKDYEERYQVSNYGRVKNKQYRYCNVRGEYRTVKEKIRKLSNINGYQFTSLPKDVTGSVYRNIPVHRLVAQAFIINVENKPSVDHIDTRKNNNCVYNLRWVTNYENMQNEQTRKNVSERTKEAIKGRRSDHNNHQKRVRTNIGSEEDIFSPLDDINSERYLSNVNFKDEIWKVTAQNDKYSVSNYGRVKRDGHVLRQCKYKTGYMSVDIKITSWETNSKGTRQAVHILLMDAFVPNVDNLPVINHKDLNRSNNMLSNLERCTHKYNSQYGLTRELAKKSIEKHLENTVRKVVEYDRFGNYLNIYDSVQKLSESLNVYKDMIYSVISRKSIINGKQYRYYTDGMDLNENIGLPVFGRTINQYTIDGKFLYKYYSYEDVMEKNPNITRQDIVNFIDNDNGYKKGFIWRATDGSDVSDIEPYHPNKLGVFVDGVDQYTLTGEFIKHWDRLDDIQNTLKYNKIDVARCCRHVRESYKGFQWLATCYKEQPRDLTELHIIQYTLTGKFVRLWKNIDMLYKKPGCNVLAVRECLKKNRVHYKNSQWRYEDDDTPIMDVSDIQVEVRINQYSLDGKFINQYNNAADAARHTKVKRTKILHAIDSVNGKTCGFIWRRVYSRNDDGDLEL